MEENRLGGSSLLECVVFGKIAGKQASQKSQWCCIGSELYVGTFTLHIHITKE